MTSLSLPAEPAAVEARNARDTREPVAWALHDGKAGMASQALGLAEATGFALVEKPLSIRLPWACLPPQLWLAPLRAAGAAGARLVPPWPDLVIACGRNAAMPALAIRRASAGRAFAAQIQDPGVGRDEFDLLVVPEHDRLRGPRVVVTQGAVHRVTAAGLAAERRRFPALAAMPRPILTVLIGGANRAYRLPPRRLGEIADLLAGLLRESGGSVLATPSRRTGAAGAAMLRERLARPAGGSLGRRRGQPLLRLSRLRRRAAGDRRFGVDGQRGGGDRQARPHPRPRRRQRQVRALSRGDARRRHYPAVFRPDRDVVLPDPGRHRPRRRGVARAGPRPARGAAAGMRAAAVYFALVAVAAALFLLAPQLDLAASRLFYAPGAGFLLADWPPVVILYRAVPWLAWGALLLVAAAAARLFLTGRPWRRLDRKALVFVVATLALGPGLLANTLLKDHWGRARPAQIEAFGGTRHFTPAPLPAAECAQNCSFVSGHAALGFALVAFAFLLPPGPSRRWGIAAALGFGALIGLGRMAQGAHFLSDVVFAGLLVYGVAAALHWAIVDRDALAAPAPVRLYRSLGHAAAASWGAARRCAEEPAGRLGLWAAAAAIAVVVSIAAIDRPLAYFFHDKGPDLHGLFDLTGRLGLTWGYLTVFGLAFAALHWGGAAPRLRPLAAPMRALSAVPAFLFAALAASGLAVDLLKVLFGRTRPKLLFSSDIFAFTWLGARADHWSFPSGHAATIAALATALWCLWPRHLLFYILLGVIVSASRLVVGAHYLSDTLAGAFIAVVATRGVALLFAKGGIDLARSRRARAAASGGPPWPCRLLGRAALRRGPAG